VLMDKVVLKSGSDRAGTESRLDRSGVENSDPVTRVFREYIL